jgi:hypothetical protein
MRGSMRTAALTILVLALSACAKPEGPPPVDLVERALEAAGGPEPREGIRQLGLEIEGRLSPPGGEGAETPFAMEWALDGTDGIATRVTTGGLLTRKAADGEGGWFRRGAAVEDLPPHGLRDERADRDDLLALLLSPLLSPPFRLESAGENRIRVTREGGDPFLLAFDPETGLPARIERVSESADGKETELVRTIGEWTDFDGLLFPARIVTELAGGSQTIEIRRVVANPEVLGAAFARPDDSGPGTVGEIRREEVPSRNVVAVAQQGPYTDLASVDLYMDRALEHAKATKTGPRVRIFRRFARGDEPPVVVTMAPVEFGRDSQAIGLPRGMRVELLPSTDALVMPYEGPYPVDDSLYEPLRKRAGELGLVPIGPPWHVLLSDPDLGEPNELRQEIRLPVKEAD